MADWQKEGSVNTAYYVLFRNTCVLEQQDKPLMGLTLKE